MARRLLAPRREVLGCSVLVVRMLLFFLLQVSGRAIPRQGCMCNPDTVRFIGPYLPALDQQLIYLGHRVRVNMACKWVEGPAGAPHCTHRTETPAQWASPNTCRNEQVRTRQRGSRSSKRHLFVCHPIHRLQPAPSAPATHSKRHTKRTGQFVDCQGAQWPAAGCQAYLKVGENSCHWAAA